MTLRICIDARIESGRVGGVEQVACGIASGLASLQDGDEQYYYLAYEGCDDWIAPMFGGRAKPLYEPGRPRDLSFRERIGAAIPPMRLAFHAARRWLWRYRVPSTMGTIERAGIDVVHFPFQPAFLTNVPSIYHPWDLQYMHLPELFTAYERASRREMHTRLCRQARLVAVANSWTKNDIAANLAVPADRIAVVPVAPLLAGEGKASQVEQDRVRTLYELPGDFIFYPAVTWPHKNHLGLIEALAILRRAQGVTIPAVFTGRDWPHKAKVIRRAAELGVGGQIRFLGHVPRNDVTALYALSKAVVFPTRFEGGGLPLLEAMLAGRPVACSNVTALPAVAGDAALVFNPDDPQAIAGAVWRLWSDDDLRARLVAAGTERVAQFTWETAARLFRAHYRRLGGRGLTDVDRALLTEPPIV
ncbi:MAG TPA: glycosyltransferase family 1 protein [Thermoanaerobaculia bacterium]|nr:glycosyltransferase family 1 protein [Thermoanaerobaculia bacterium]